MNHPLSRTLTTGALLAIVAFSAQAEEVGGALQYTPPESWQAVKPRSRIVQREYSVTHDKAEDDTPAARMTITSAGGGVEANLARWVGQFQNVSDGAQRREKIEVAGMPVSLLDIEGTYLEGMRPFGPKTPRPEYRMLAAVVETGAKGDYFFKLVGPAAVVAQHAEAFREMVEGITPPSGAGS
ncbi:hypothetical protein Mal64_22480 [Pseudobythopirellula maris]|uniref:PsbP C-terminal domain-containing protein n=1 Tax=Pseudobythopirellula maris TaxID=2527991 RepID=A0A5C5ZNJ9_9BACT|nr:hypothetical protein [Pseudobythopirellula maris]TWT88760.1 hypothetical protein Mal64_22480 [Pseudobythopirellula maris]